MAASTQFHLGIDVGSSQTVVATWGRTEVTRAPCCVAAICAPGTDAQNLGAIAVGEAALQGAIANPKNTAWALPRLMGRNTEHPTVALEHERVPTHFEVNGRNEPMLFSGQQQMWPEEGLAELLADTVRCHQQRLKGPNDDIEAVFTVPARCTRSQRQALHNAARLAGIEVMQLIAAPLAAALAHVHANGARQATALERPGDAAVDLQSDAPDGLYLVVDVGAGSCDMALLEVAQQHVTVLQQDAVEGSGDAVDDALVQAVASDFFDDHGIDLRQHPMALVRLALAINRATQSLHARPSTELELPFVVATTDGPKHLQTRIESAMLAAATAHVLAPMMATCEAMLERATVDAAALTGVWLTGGLQDHTWIGEALLRLGAPVHRLDATLAARGAALVAATRAEQLVGPTYTITDAAQALAVPEGYKGGIMQHELQQLLDAQHERAKKAEQLQAHVALKQRAERMLAGFDAQQNPQSESEPETHPTALKTAMGALQHCLDQSDDSEEAFLALHARLQALDVALAQHQHGAAHA